MDDLDFRVEISKLLISKNGYICDCCTNWEANAIMLRLLKARIKKHPLLWKWFFMIA